MALIFSDRVKETTAVVGLGDVTLLGSPTGFDTFLSGIAVGNTCYYAIVNNTNGEWEVGLGTLSGATTLQRTTVYASSSSDAKVDFTSGVKDIFNTIPAQFIASISSGSGNLPVGGTAGQILSKIDSVDYNVQWIDNYASQIKHYVKLGEDMSSIGTAVYVAYQGSSSTNMLVRKASNTSEATSSKTLGLIASSGVTNDFVFVVTEGLLSGINTSSAAQGDPVWLGVNGALIFGLANKPVAPSHLVFIGVVTRVQSVNGEIFVKCQNGFEIEELHNVLFTSKADKDLMYYDSANSLWKNAQLSTILGYAPANDSNVVHLSGSETITGYKTFGIGYNTNTGNNLLNITSGSTYVGYASAPAGTYKLGVNGNALLEGILNKNLYTDTAFGTTSFKIGTGYELYGILHSAGGYETYLTTTGFASSWSIVIGNSTNKAAVFNYNNVTLNQPLSAASGISNVTGGGNLSTFSVSPYTGFKYTSGFSWSFAVRDSSDNNVLSLWDDGNVGIGYNTKQTPSYKFNVNGTAKFNGNTYCGVDILISNNSGTRMIQSPNGSIGFARATATDGFTLWTSHNKTGVQGRLGISNTDVTAMTLETIRLSTASTQTSPSTYGVELMFSNIVNHVQTYAAIRGGDAPYGGSTTTPPVSLYIFGGQNTTNSVYGNVYLAHDFTTPRGAVGIGTLSIDTSAILEVDSTTKGVLVPRMTAAQKSAITSPSVGLLIYQTDGTEGHYEYASTGWRIINASGGGGTGTVTSVGLTSSATGLSISGSPITGSGTFNISFSAGYGIPSNTSMLQWNDAYNLYTIFPSIGTPTIDKILTNNGLSMSWVTISSMLDADLNAIAALTGTSGFLKKTAANTWALDTNTYLTSFTETDPIFTASAAYGITSTDKTNWSSAYSWGNHASAGYAVKASTNTFTQVNTFSDATDSSSSTTGAAIFSGGIGVAKNIYVGGNLNVTGNTVISGDLTVSGTTVTVNATNLAVEDNMIYLNNGSTIANPDLGIAGNYNDGTYRHAGIFRDATDGVWKFFHQYTPEPDTSVFIDTTHASFALANVQASTFIGALQGNADTVTNGLYSTGSYANPSWVTSLAWSKITGAPSFTTLTSFSGTAPISYNNTTGAISISQSTTSTNGYLSSTDWNTFNGKQNALSGTGIVKSTAGTISYIALGTSSQLFAADGSLVTIGTNLTLSGGTLSASGGGGSSTVSFNRQTANYTLALSDSGNVVEVNSSTAVTVTVPLNSAVGFSVGSQIVVTQYGVGTPVFSPQSGVTIRSANSSLAINAQYSSVTLIKVATDEWYLVGGISKGNSVQTTSITSDVINNNATANTIADVTGLSFPVTAGKTYFFRFWIRYTSAAQTTGSRWSINGPATSYLLYNSQYTLTATTFTNNYNQASYNLPAASNASSNVTTANNVAIIEGTITPSASGTVIARFASEVANSAITAKVGSFVNYQQMN